MKLQAAGLVATIILAASSAYGVSPQEPNASAPAQPARIHVDAPFAEYLVMKEKAMHPEIQKLGMHATPPGETQSAIIANNLPDKVGKVSAPSDLQIVAAGKPQAVKKDGFWDTFVPFHDGSGTTIGFLIMEVPFSTAKVPDGAIAVGVAIRNEVEKQVPTKATLFGPAPQE